MPLNPHQEPLINPNPSLQSYYHSLESRLGYRFFLGGTRHFGYYPRDTYWPFPLNGALRAMEDHLYDALRLARGATVLDAGCGVGHVAIHLARRGLRIEAIDVVDHHLQKARRNVEASGLAVVKIYKMDYHHLAFADESLDGVYTMETLVHSPDPERALAEFFRVLRPGGHIALFEYDHDDGDGELAPNRERDAMAQVNRYAAMPANARFSQGVLQSLLEQTGFRDVGVEDLSMNIRPMLRLFFVVAFVPYLVIRLLGLQAWFVNTMAGFEGYRGRHRWRYVVVTAKKPFDGWNDEGGSAREGKKVR
ncbi:MAG: hypothetical protein M1816_007446 [Peltula sp. TS41687]|nr:MAG: hypothetical protein M1816_007446 [Peltula sp. TS41687]